MQWLMMDWTLRVVVRAGGTAVAHLIVFHLMLTTTAHLMTLISRSFKQVFVLLTTNNAFLYKQLFMKF